MTNGVTTRADDSFVELGPGRQWIQIDLEEEHEIFAIHVWHGIRSGQAVVDVVVQISSEEEFENEDGTTADHVTTVFNADHDRSSGLGLAAATDPVYRESHYGRVMPVDGVRGRYVRLYSNGNTSDPLNLHLEVMVYGRPPNPCCAERAGEVRVDLKPVIGEFRGCCG